MNEEAAHLVARLIELVGSKRKAKELIDGASLAGAKGRPRGTLTYREVDQRLIVNAISLELLWEKRRCKPSPFPELVRKQVDMLAGQGHGRGWRAHRRVGWTDLFPSPAGNSASKKTDATGYCRLGRLFGQGPSRRGSACPGGPACLGGCASPGGHRRRSGFGAQVGQKP
jgi:hypothetical protein